MKRYWDLSEKERAALTSEQVDAMLAVELMEKGVVRVDPPVLLPVEFVKPASKTMYQVKHDRSYGGPSVVYPNTVEAEAATTTAVPLCSDYIGGETYYYASPQAEICVTPIQVSDRAAIAACKSANEKAAANKKANEAAERDYDIAIRAVNDATDGVWSDWRGCQAKQSRYQRIADTFAEYRELCGDDQIAWAFLVKAFPAGEVADANGWIGFSPTVEVEAGELVPA